ncbi:MAG: MFS transporter [Gemmataceae bacterium]|nr:MFS transporter [Gemmataceae bacterium]
MKSEQAVPAGDVIAIEEELRGEVVPGCPDFLAGIDLIARGTSMSTDIQAVALPATKSRTIEPWRWGVVWLMFLATLINYMDRQVLGSTNEHIKNEFGLNEEGYGWVEFWFGLAYGLMQVPAGYLADRLNLRWLYAGALLVWSAAGLFTGLAQTVAILMACRVLLGLGEAFNWTCAVGIVRRIIPLESRSLANGIFHGGASIGAVLTPLLVLAVVGPGGENWRLVYQLIGALGLLWVVLWFWCIRGPNAELISRPTVDPIAAGTEQPGESSGSFRHVLMLRTFWITMAVSITVNFCWHCWRIWLPRFLKVDLHFSQTDIQYILMAFFVAADVGCMGAGWLTRRLTHAGYSVERSRKIVLVITSLMCTAALPAVLIVQPWLSLALVLVVAAGAMGGFAIFFSLSQEISARHTSLCLGILGSTAWIIIAILTPVVGRLADELGTFGPSMIAIGFVPLVGAMIGLLWPEPQQQFGRLDAGPTAENH